MQRVSKNHAALFGWVFSASFLLGVTAFTYIAIRDGGVPNTPGWVAVIFLSIFWIGAIFQAYFLLGKPLNTAFLSGPDLVLRRRWPFHKSDYRMAVRDVQTWTPRQTKDSEGDPYFEYILMLPDNKKFVMFEGHSRENIEAKIADFKRAIKSSRPPSNNAPLVS